MKRRFDLRDGMLVDRHGYELGRVVSITLEVGEGGPLRGGGVEAVDVREQQQPPLTPPADDSPSLIDVPVERRLGEDGQPVPLLSAAGEIEAVWEHYAEVMEPRNRAIDPAARALIRDALKVATLVECKRAIDGCKASAFHMGENDRNKKYNRLSQILKGKRGIRTTREQIDLFLDIAEKRGVVPSVASVDPARLAEAKRNVLTAWEMPGSRQAKELGEMSAAWLAQHGYRIEYADGGRPQFIEEGA